MEKISFTDILLYLLSGMGGLAGLHKIITFFFDRYDIARKNKKEQEAIDTSTGIEARRLDIEADTRTASELWKLIDAKQQEIERLAAELSVLRSAESLSRPTITKLYVAARELRRYVDLIDWTVTIDSDRDKLKQVIEQMRKALDELEEHLP